MNRMEVRWLTYQPGQAAEAALREETLDRIKRWWDAFTKKITDLDQLFTGRSHWDLPAWIRENLQAINSNLMWEFGPGPDGGHRLVITPESSFHLRPLVEEILRQAPKIDGWAFVGHRMPDDMLAAKTIVEARTGEPLQITGIKCAAGLHNLVDMTFEFPKMMVKRHGDLAFNQAFVTAETLLGEQALEAWVGKIETKPSSRGAFPVNELKERFTSVRSDILHTLPDRPLHERIETPDERNWSVYRLKPRRAEDYSARLDLFVGTAMLLKMCQDAHSGISFFSERFSRYGERFCYIKLDRSGDDATQEAFADRSEIEDALDKALRSRNLGCVVGGGTGLRYSYVDLALTDVIAASEAAFDVLRSGRVPLRSWLQFFDSEWQAEWLGVWEKTPPPPMPDFEP